MWARINGFSKLLQWPLFVCLSLLGFSQGVLAAPPTPLDFAMKQNVGRMELGPNGQQIAFLSRTYEVICRDDRWRRQDASKCDVDEQRLASQDRVIVVDLETMKTTRTAPLPDDVSVNWLEWTAPDNLLISITTGWKFSRRRYTPPSQRILSISTDGSAEPAVLFGDRKDVIRGNQRLGRVVNMLRSDPEHVLMAAYRRKDWDLFRVNVRDGTSVRVAKGKRRTFAWYTDRQGRPSIRMDCKDLNCRRIEVFRPEEGADPNDPDAKWIKLRTFKVEKRGDEEVREFDIVAPAEDQGHYYVIVEGEDVKSRSVKVYDVKSDSFVRDVYSDPQYDVSSALINAETGDYAGVAVWRDRLEYEFIDKSLQKHLRAVNTFFEDRWNITMVGFSDNGRVALFYASAPQDAGSYYIYDFDARSVSPLISTHESLPGEFPTRTESLIVPTRDGQKITAYHTRPENSSATTPLILLIHGGPEARDTYDFNRDVQFLASRGYQVLQPNFRGSSGYGREFAEAGYGEWGGRMHDDVIDALKYVQDRGLAKPSQACVMGHSYGGYAALYAGAANPEAFACVIAGAGVSDLNASLRQDREAYGRDSATYAYWNKSIGDEEEDKDALKAKSPIHMAAQFDDPILLIHGKEDGVVLFEQSETMHTALKKAGKNSQLLTLEDEGHFHRNWDIETSEEYFETLERFLSRALPVSINTRTSAQP